MAAETVQWYSPWCKKMSTPKVEEKNIQMGSVVHYRHRQKGKPTWYFSRIRWASALRRSDRGANTCVRGTSRSRVFDHKLHRNWHAKIHCKLHTEGMLLLELGLVSSNHSASLVYVCNQQAKLFSQPKNRNREHCKKKIEELGCGKAFSRPLS
jgi:hypothetical protein